MSVYKRGNRWIADFYIGGRNGRRIRRSAPTRKLAEAIERDRKVKEIKGELGLDKKPDISLKIFVRKYLELYSPTKALSTRQRDQYTLNHIFRFFGDPLVRIITKEDIEKYMSSRLRKVSRSTVNRELDLIQSLLNRAVEWDYLNVSPAPLVKKFKLDLEEPRFLNSSEGAALMESAEGQMKGFIVTALNTGLRKGELFQLKWDDAELVKEINVKIKNLGVVAPNFSSKHDGGAHGVVRSNQAGRR